MFLSASGNDFDEAVEVFAANFELPVRKFAPLHDNFQWSLSVAGDELMTFRRIQILARVELDVVNEDEIVVVWPVSGEMTLQERHNVIEPALTVPSILPAGRIVTQWIANDPTTSLIHINRTFLAGVAQELETDFVAFEVSAPATQRALRIWRKTVNLVAAVVLDTAAAESALMRREAARLIAVTMLKTFPYQTLEQVSPQRGVEPASVQRAYDFIHDNAHLPISPADVAQAAGLSIRSLQQALRRYRETTPTALLYQVRLERVRAELIAAEPSRGTVTAIARHWGFVSLGRFSAAYRERFGQLPNETLRGMH